jgi:hypothetical protein
MYRLQIFPPQYNYIFLLTNLTANKSKFQSKLHIVLIQGINTIFIDQLPTSEVFKHILCRLRNIQQFSIQTYKSQGEKAQLKLALRKLKG